MPLGTVPLVIPFPQKGNGILFLCGFSYYYPILPLGEWDLVFVWFHVPIIIIVVVVVVVVNNSYFLIFQDISMKLGGHMGHGPNSSYHHL